MEAASGFGELGWLCHAKFPVVKDLDDFVFEESAVNEKQIRSLYDGSFIER